MSTPVTCFIIMPFLPELQIVRDVVKRVVHEHGNGIAFRSDDSFHPGDIIEQVKAGIANADFCIADVTDANANVLWETGYAHALNKPIIQISQDAASLVFDIRALRTEEYSLDALRASAIAETHIDFHARLEGAVQAVITKLRGKVRILGPVHDELSTLAEQLDRCSVFKGRREPLLRIVLRALAWDRSNGPHYSWRTTDAERLATALRKTAGGAAQDSFWWLIAHGVFAYDQIVQFQEGDSDGIRENLPLVKLSERGVRLLNQLHEPI
jgi:hypothetical protein